MGRSWEARPGPIQTRDDFEKYPWDELASLYWQAAEPRFQALEDVCLQE